MSNAKNLLLVPTVAGVFQFLEVSAALYHQASWWPLPWWGIHLHESVLRFENEYGGEGQRHAYNEASFRKVEKQKRTVRGEHGGYSDLFVPVLARGKVAAILVAGPFLLARPTSVQILERWRTLTGHQGHLADPRFSAYLSAALQTLVLDGDLAAAFQNFLEISGRLMAGEGVAEVLTRQVLELRSKLEQARFVDHAWRVVETMIDDRSLRFWDSANLIYELGKLGLSHLPDQVLVGLSVDRAKVPEPVDAAVRHDAFQRSVVEFAQKAGELIAGRVGDHGVVFLSSASGTKERRKRKLLELSERVSTLAARQFGLGLHFGIWQGSSTSHLSHGYQAALGAAESALTLGSKVALAEVQLRQSVDSLRRLRQGLTQSLLEKPGLLPSRFDRYLEAVAVRCSYRIALARTHLEVGFEKITEQLSRRGELDPKSLEASFEALERAAEAARTMPELFLAYRRAVADVVQAVEAPVPARHDRNLRAAVDFVNQHYTEALSARQVARIGGFSPSYFSLLFKEREGMTFEDYVRKLRLSRAQQLLAGTEFSVTRVAELSGHRSITYFCRSFRRSVGMTPLQYRKRQVQQEYLKRRPRERKMKGLSKKD